MVAFMCWLHVGAHVQNVLPGHFQTRIDTLPKWVQTIKLLPNQTLLYDPETTVNGQKYMAALRLQSFIPKAALVDKRDSILQASRLFVKGISDTLRLTYGSEMTVTTCYIDRCRAGAGISRNIEYVLNGRKIQLDTDSSFDESNNLDSAISSRLEQYPIDPNQYFMYDKKRETIILQTLTDRCTIGEPVKNNTPDIWAQVINLHILFEVVQRDYSKLQGVSCGCIDPRGKQGGSESHWKFAEMQLEKNYESMYRDYKERYSHLKKQ